MEGKMIKNCRPRIVFGPLCGLTSKNSNGMNAKEQQFITVIREHERTIYTVCYMFSSDTDEVNDLYQDILVRLWQGFDAFEGKSDIKTWIYRVSLNYDEIGLSWVLTLLQYKKHVRKCRELLDQFEE